MGTINGLAGIVLTSIIWRVFLSQAFSLPLCVVLMGVCNALPVGLLVHYWCIRATPDLRRGDAAVSRYLLST